MIAMASRSRRSCGSPKGAALSYEAMRAQLSERVARYKVPRYLEIVDAFPVTPSGKVQKFKLREQFLAQRSSAV